MENKYFISEPMMLGGYYNLHTNDKCSKDIFSENNGATFPKNVAAQRLLFQRLAPMMN